MSAKMSNEKQHLVLNNMGLVHYLVKRLGVTQNSPEYEDLVSIGTIGLLKAATTFDTSKGIKFATYASRCINNEIFMYYRKANKYEKNISIDKSIGDDGEGKELTLADILEESESNFVEKIENREECINLISIILNSLKRKWRSALLYLMGNLKQRQIADKLNISQSYVSRIEVKAAREVRKIISQQVHYKEVFSMAMVGNEYRISFSSKDIKKFNKIFAKFLQNLTSTENLPDFKVNCNNQRIIIQVPALPESFSFIAEIIQEIDDFSMSFVSDKTTVPAEDTSIKKSETDVECIPQECLDTDTVVESEKEVSGVQINEQIVPTLTDTDEAHETNSQLKVEGKSQEKQVREYMLSMDSFTAKDLKLHFPNFNYWVISNCISHAKSAGLITAIKRGEYVVNKT